MLKALLLTLQWEICCRYDFQCEQCEQGEHHIKYYISKIKAYIKFGMLYWSSSARMLCQLHKFGEALNGYTTNLNNPPTLIDLLNVGSNG
jgi:hypothetical protein